MFTSQRTDGNAEFQKQQAEEICVVVVVFFTFRRTITVENVDIESFSSQLELTFKVFEVRTFKFTAIIFFSFLL